MYVQNIYIDDCLCYYSYKFKQEFKKYYHFRECRNGALWCQCPPLLSFNDTVWIHVWDDSPFSGPTFEQALKSCNPKKNFFVQYKNINLDSFNEFVENRFNTCYPNVDERNEHVFLINPETNVGMDKLVEAVRIVIHSD